MVKINQIWLLLNIIINQFTRLNELDYTFSHVLKIAPLEIKYSTKQPILDIEIQPHTFNSYRRIKILRIILKG